MDYIKIYDPTNFHTIQPALGGKIDDPPAFSWKKKFVNQACGPWWLAVGPFLRMKRRRGSRGFTRRGFRWLKNFTTDGEDEEPTAVKEGGTLQKLAHENIERKMGLNQNIHDERVNFLRFCFHKYRSNPPQRMQSWQEARNVMSSWWRLHFGVGRSKEEHTRTNQAKL